MLAQKNSNATLGQDIIVAGLFIQIIGFGVFIFVSLLFHKRMHANPTPISMQPDMPWQKYVYTLYFASLLIMIRSIVRVIEYVQGNAGYILSHEVFLYIFDGQWMERSGGGDWLNGLEVGDSMCKCKETRKEMFIGHSKCIYVI